MSHLNIDAIIVKLFFPGELAPLVQIVIALMLVLFLTKHGAK